MDIYKKTVVKLHSIWFLLWALILVFMILPSSQVGHLSIMIFAGYPFVIGIFGHLFLFFVIFLFRFSKKYEEATNLTDNSWPWQTIIALVVFAYITFNYIILSNFYAPVLMKVMSLYMNIGSAQTTHGQGGFSLGYLIINFAPIILSLLGLYGIVTRSRWCYKFIQGVCLFIVIALPSLVILALISGDKYTKLYITLPTFAVLLAVYLYLFSRSDKVKQFFTLE